MAPKLVQITFPARTPNTLGLLKAQGFLRKGSKREIDRHALGRQLIAAHDGRTRLIVNVYIGS